jgi:hypothetical protein
MLAYVKNVAIILLHPDIVIAVNNHPLDDHGMLQVGNFFSGRVGSTTWLKMNEWQ